MASNPPSTPHPQQGARCRPTDVCDLLLERIRQVIPACDAARQIELAQKLRQLAAEASTLKQQLLSHALQPVASQQRVLALMQGAKELLGEKVHHEILQRAVSMINMPSPQQGAMQQQQQTNNAVMQAYLRSQAAVQNRGNAQTVASQNSSAVAAAAAAIMRQGHQNGASQIGNPQQATSQNRGAINNAQFIQQLRTLQQQQQQQQQRVAQSHLVPPQSQQQQTGVGGGGSGVNNQLASTLQDQINRILSPRPSPMSSPASVAASDPAKRARIEPAASPARSHAGSVNGNLLLPPPAASPATMSPQRPPLTPQNPSSSPVLSAAGDAGKGGADALDALEQLIMAQQRAASTPPPMASPSASPLTLGSPGPAASPGWDGGSPSASPSPLSLASTPQIDMESVRRAHKEQMLMRIGHRVQRRGVVLASQEVLTALGDVMEHWAEVAQQMLHRISKHRAELYPSQIARHLSQSRDTSTEEWYRRKKDVGIPFVVISMNSCLSFTAILGDVGISKDPRDGRSHPAGTLIIDISASFEQEQSAYMGALCKAVIEHRDRAAQEAAEARANRTGTGQGAKSRAAASRAAGGSLPSPEEMRQQEMEQQQAMHERLVTGATRSLVNAERMLSTDDQRKQIVAEALEQHVTSIQDVRKVGLRDLMALLKMPPPNGHNTWIHGIPGFKVPEGMRQRLLVEISQGAYTREYNIANEQRVSGGARG